MSAPTTNCDHAPLPVSHSPDTAWHLFSTASCKSTMPVPTPAQHFRQSEVVTFIPHLRPPPARATFNMIMRCLRRQTDTHLLPSLSDHARLCLLSPAPPRDDDQKIFRTANAPTGPADEVETVVAQALIDLESNVSELKAELRPLQISCAKEIEVKGGKKAIVIFVPMPQLKAFHKIQQR
ncbi:hypothetical protein PANT_3d00081 [Moesziomyces antarcticus T-34]|uniref:40S ribosomal protein S7 n=1 Tax=Pseudozyma antarctica (strain T-34) TaxID=1151754 RepID=M9LJM1_PSEA3|nr:hypothetical protein PANT_3d00081 [Moesziomyces antarcticus T-34]